MNETANGYSLDEVLTKHKYVLLEFHAAWCEPCKWAEPVVREVMEHFGDAMHLHKIDIDLQPSLSKDFRVLSVPTFVLLKDGAELWRMRGFDIGPVMIRSIANFIS